MHTVLYLITQRFQSAFPFDEKKHGKRNLGFSLFWAENWGKREKYPDALQFNRKSYFHVHSNFQSVNLSVHQFRDTNNY